MLKNFLDSMRCSKHALAIIITLPPTKFLDVMSPILSPLYPTKPFKKNPFWLFPIEDRHGVDLVERLKNEGIRGRVYTVSDAGHTVSLS